MSDTPRTDAAAFSPGTGNQWEELVDADFARQLERELKHARMETEAKQRELALVRSWEKSAWHRGHAMGMAAQGQAVHTAFQARDAAKADASHTNVLLTQAMTDLERELAEARKALTNACDSARDFPANTCPASRHVQQMAEELLSGGYPMLTEEPAHCAESMLATVRALWEARKDAARYRWLRENGGQTWQETASQPAGIRPCIFMRVPALNDSGSFILRGEQADAAIDAAMVADPPAAEKG